MFKHLLSGAKLQKIKAKFYNIVPWTGVAARPRFVPQDRVPGLETMLYFFWKLQ
jgi:hypothetical protein